MWKIAIPGMLLGDAILQQQAQILPVATLGWLCIVILGLLIVSVLLQKYCPVRYFSLALSVFMRQFSIFLATTIFGFVWASCFALNHLAQPLQPLWEDKSVTVIGVVDSLPQNFAEGQRFQFVLEKSLPDAAVIKFLPHKISLAWYRPLNYGKSRGQSASFSSLNALSENRVHAGQRWQLRVRLKPAHGNANPHGFEYELWLLEQGILATGSVQEDNSNHLISNFVWSLSHTIDRYREKLRDKLYSALPQAPYASVLVALVIGEQSEISQADWKLFNRTGVAHLVSISGLHITMVAGLFASLAGIVWRQTWFFGAGRACLILPAQTVAALTGAVTAFMYVALAGFGIPAQRTLYLLLFYAVAQILNRRSPFSHMLLLALALVILIDPWAIMWPGFWLSFVAVALLLYAHRTIQTAAQTKDVGLRSQALPEYSYWQKIRKIIILNWRGSSYAQYVVTIGMLPLTLFLFAQFSIVSPIANALAIPLIGLGITPLALLAIILPEPLHIPLLKIAHASLQYLMQFLRVLSDLPFAVYSLPAPELWMLLIAMPGIFWLFAPRGWPYRALGLICCAPIFFNPVDTPKSGQMRVIAFDVGQGMALLIETSKHRMMYDSGPFYSPESDGGTRVILPYLHTRGINALDLLLISHNDNDHSGGALSLLRALEVKQLSSSLKFTSPVLKLASQQQVSVQRCQSGQRWHWDGFEFEILQPGSQSYRSEKWKPNALSCTLKITGLHHSILLPGDIEAVQEDELIHSIPEKLASTVLLAPHHGSGTSSTAAFLKAVHPELAIFQLGYLNRYRHPKPEIYQRYQDFGIKRLRTDETGAITLIFGSNLEISQYRTEHARYWYPIRSE